MIRVTCLGGAGSVTGSCYLVESPQNKKILVDCGLFQGGRQIEDRNKAPWGFDPKEVETLFLTHAHIDHSGRIPKLVKDGFNGRIITSPPTAELCEIMLLDAAHIQEMDAEWQTRKNKRQAGRDVTPLYTTEDAQTSLKLLHPMERDQIITVESGVKARLRNAGHILGSSILELWVEDGEEALKIVFSGDLGKKDQLIVKDPHEIFNADYLFVESTYGNRRHRSFEESKRELAEAIHYSAAAGEKVIIPAFAVERTQELLYILGEFLRNGLIPDIPIYLDSPLAIKATEIFRKNKKYYDEEASAIVDSGYDPFGMPNLRFTPATRESMAINEASGPAIVIAGSGMCTAGRIKHHLKHNLWRPGASIVIVGFQAKGSTGRRIVDGAKQVKIFRENVAVRARVFTIGGFSAHADQEDLLEWVSHFESSPRVFVVHGEAAASTALAEKIRERLHLMVHIPTWRERLILKPKDLATEKPAAEEEAPDVKALMLNTIIDLENELKTLRKKVQSAEVDRDIGEDEIDRLRYIQDDLKSVFGS
jgi:metallo-beta-lactamase family protein